MLLCHVWLPSWSSQKPKWQDFSSCTIVWQETNKHGLWHKCIVGQMCNLFKEYMQTIPSQICSDSVTIDSPPAQILFHSCISAALIQNLFREHSWNENMKRSVSGQRKSGFNLLISLVCHRVGPGSSCGSSYALGTHLIWLTRVSLDYLGLEVLVTELLAGESKFSDENNNNNNNNNKNKREQVSWCFASNRLQPLAHSH